MRQTSHHEIQVWLSELDRFCNEGRCQSPRFWKPYHFLTLALRAKARGMTGLTLPDEFEGYAARMGLWEAVGLEPPCRVGRQDPSGRFLPVEALRNYGLVDQSADSLAEITRQQSATISEESLRITLLELLNNCFDHAEPDSDLFGLACAQTWPRGNLAQIAIADLGIGVRATLERGGLLAGRLHQENACLLATEYGVTGKPDDHHSGYGLTLAAEIAENNGGRLLVVSGTEIALCTQGGRFATHVDAPWPGTLLVFEWRTDQPLDADAVYRSWPTPEGMTDEDFL